MGDFAKTFAWFAGIVLLFLIIFMPVRYFNNASNTAFEEFKPSEMLRKYEWFKDAAASLDGKLNDISVYETRIQQLVDSYEGVARKDWDRTDKETMNVWNLEVAGIKASYNQLAAEYNSNISKFNWSAFEGDKPTEYKMLLEN